MAVADQHSLPGLVGRDAELATLRTRLEASERRGQAVLVCGPPGVGKSRLLAELRRMFRRAGRPVLEGRCDPTDFRPHGPMLGVLGGAVELLRDLGHPHPRLTRALELMAGYGGGSAETTGQALLFNETVRQALIELAEVRAPLLCVRDLHLADPGTLALMRYLLENLLTDPAFEWTPEADEDTPAFRGLLAVTFRDGPALQPLLDAARASEAIECLRVDPWEAAGVRAFLASDAVVDRLLAATGGSPAALNQWVQSLPSDAEALWRDRLARVPAHAVPLLDALAVLRVPASIEALRELTEAGLDDWGALTELVDRRVLDRTLDGGVVRFCFHREEARERHLAGVEAQRRRSLHRRVAERLALTARGAEAEAVARHFLDAGAQAEAVPFAIAAADHLRSACAFARAAALLESVVGAADGELVDAIRERLAGLYLEGGQLTRARATLTHLAQTDDPVAASRVALRLAELDARAGDPEGARAGALAALDTSPDPEVARALAALAAEAAYQLGDLDDAAARCAEWLDAAPEDAAATSLRNTLGKVHLAREALDDADALFTRNLEVARARPDAVQQARAQTNLGVVALQRGDRDAALALFEATRDLAAVHGDLRHLALSVENLGVLFHRRKDFPRALGHYHQSTAAFRQLGHRRQLATTALNLADLYLTMGDLTRARRLAHIAGDLIDRGAFRHLEAQRLMLDGDLAREDGDDERAAQRYDAAAAILERGGSNQRLGPLRWAQAELALEAGDLDRARQALEQASSLPGTRSDAFAARLRMTRGALAVAEGDTEGALNALEAAISQAETAEDRETEWQALSRLADAHWARADRASTLQALAAAVEIIEGIAAELPATLRERFLDAPSRRGVRDALKRVRAGIAPRGPRLAEPAVALKRQAADYNVDWATRYPKIIGRAPALFPVFNALDRVAGSDSMVLIRGESGTGKELVAAALHAHSPRGKNAFVKVNCAAFVETLLLSELFGHEKGAFTGAVSAKKGRFELADRGTLFLDEIGDISSNTQVALLRVLQEGTFERVGGSQTQRVDVRLICATNRDLEAMVEAGAFRSDLYYRLRGVIIETPPLRARARDIPLLVDHFLARRTHAGRRALHFSRPAMASLLQHHWPGNVRELENVVRSVALFADGDRIGLAELAELGDIFRPPEEAALLALSEVEAQLGEPTPEPVVPTEASSPMPEPAPPDAVFDESWLERMLVEEGSLSDVKKRIEFVAIARALRTTGGNITRAAERLGMKRPRLSQIIHATPALGEIKREVTGR